MRRPRQLRQRAMLLPPWLYGRALPDGTELRLQLLLPRRLSEFQLPLRPGVPGSVSVASLHAAHVGLLHPHAPRANCLKSVQQMQPEMRACAC